MHTCIKCGIEIPEEEVMLGKKLIDDTDFYEEFCLDCYNEEVK